MSSELPDPQLLVEAAALEQFRWLLRRPPAPPLAGAFPSEFAWVLPAPGPPRGYLAAGIPEIVA